MVWTQIAAALIGLVGVPLGIALGEFLRRRQRAEHTNKCGCCSHQQHRLSQSM